MLARPIFLLLLSLGSLEAARGRRARLDSTERRIGGLVGGAAGNEPSPNRVESEYPKANETLREIYRQEWRAYYDCLENQARDATAEKTAGPIILSVLAGTCVELRCELCLSPGESRETGRIEWRYNGTSTTADLAEGNAALVNLPIEALSDRVLVTPDARSLRFCNIEETEGGIYWCELGDTVSAPYHLEVDPGTESTRSVKPEGVAAEPRNRPAPPEILEEYGLRVFTRWTAWSSCSTCGKVGHRTRYGYCTISMIENSLEPGGRDRDVGGRRRRRRRSFLAEDDQSGGATGSESARSTIEKRDEDQGAAGESASERTGSEAPESRARTPPEARDEYESDESDESVDVESRREARELARRLLPIFRNRLPCGSSKTPKEFRRIERIAERKTEIMTGLCKVLDARPRGFLDGTREDARSRLLLPVLQIECEKRVIFEIRDNRGHVLESANNSAGIFSMVQGLPEARASVERVTIYRKHGSAISLACPGNLNTDVPVVWRIGTRELVPSILREETDGRVSLDSRQRIIIERARFADSLVYGCWQRGRLAGTIRLRVTDRSESFRFDHRVFLIGALGIVSVLVWVFWRAFAARGRFRAAPRGPSLPPPIGQS